MNYNFEQRRVTLSELFRGIAWDYLIICFLGLIIAGVGFLSNDIALYFFGFIFFLAGFFIGINEKALGLIFLFSHGIVGLTIIEASILKTAWGNPVLTDGGELFFLSLGFILLLFLIATVITIIHNISDAAKEIKWFKIIPFALYMMGIISSIILVKLYHF